MTPTRTRRRRRPPPAAVHPTLPPAPPKPVGAAELSAAYGTESLAAAAAYLRAFAAADTATADRLLTTCTPAELIAGLTVLGCVLADLLGGGTDPGTTAVLHRIWQHTTRLHRTAIGLT